MIVAALASAAGVLAIGAVVAVALPRLHGLRAQLVVLGAAAALLPAVAVVTAGLVMLTAHDVLLLALVAGSAVVATSAVASVIALRIAKRVARLRAAAGALASGDLSVRTTEEGPVEVGDLARSFNEMAASLARLIETRRNLVAWASHDLRAPLASLQAMIEALQDGLEEPARYLPEMRRQVRLLATLVDDLFELSRIETGALSLEPTQVSLADLAAECVRSVEPQARAKGLRLELRTGDGDARVRCSPDKIERVLRNLLVNAVRHTPSDGSVAVRVGKRDGAVTVTVEDTGAGIPAGSVDRVFESFWRADPSRSSASGGAGLGLAIARGLVEAHGGRIWAENREGGGARFVFTLPGA